MAVVDCFRLTDRDSTLSTVNRLIYFVDLLCLLPGHFCITRFVLTHQQ